MPETYWLLFEVGSTRNRPIYELLYRWEEQPDMQSTSEASRQVIRARREQLEVSEQLREEMEEEIKAQRVRRSK